MRIELLFFEGCPHVPQTRERLRALLVEAQLPPTWTEHDLRASSSPDWVRAYGSPTVLVDGNDVAAGAPSAALSCRVYANSDVKGVPAVDDIRAALRR